MVQNKIKLKVQTQTPLTEERRERVIQWNRILRGLFLIAIAPLMEDAQSEDETAAQKFNELNPDAQRHIIQRGPHSESTVLDLPDNRQQLQYQITALHPRGCIFALNRISHYERYQEWLDVVTESKYDMANKDLYTEVSIPFPPIKTRANVKIPLMSEEGSYQFIIQGSRFDGLTGIIMVEEVGERCLFHMESSWEGEHSQINSAILGFASRILGVVVMETLFSME
ncbi:MAG: hypothetical protein OXB84_02950 [Halobacteriovoraceae bacterium]|nr:hypothetical protein [Halobacteriovoraceae bacterium]